PRQPSFAVSLLIILLPVILMLGSTLAKVAMSPESPVALTLKFLGEPLIALGLAVIAAVICLGWFHFRKPPGSIQQSHRRPAH
ncbi:GntT/GntP/DsdX family permease, partial [Klebsiella pneumoniae]|uniref:GntT/GntP/DsdX family permease n=1 Tax=Klebsiella pneumoniae TaxID=573 RepID=UPI002752B8BC|nr:hypothetical protein [Klebsiella pneumoniae]